MERLDQKLEQTYWENSEKTDGPEFWKLSHEERKPLIDAQTKLLKEILFLRQICELENKSVIF